MSEHVIWESENRRAVRILCTDMPGAYPIVGYFIDSMYCTIFHWTAEGRLAGSGAPGTDLIIPEGTVIGSSE